MFTGLIETVATVSRVDPVEAGYRLRLDAALSGELQLGESVSVDGVCLTVAAREAGAWEADIGPETARVTTLGSLRQGQRVNLERALRADSRFGGHFVQGHVDAIGCVDELRREQDFHWLTVSYPDSLAPLIVNKGSIAIDGISLTVAGLAPGRFEVMVIPFTMEHTNLGSIEQGERVNLECDMVGKYVVRAAELAGLTLHAVRPDKTYEG